MEEEEGVAGIEKSLSRPCHGLLDTWKRNSTGSQHVTTQPVPNRLDEKPEDRRYHPEEEVQALSVHHSLPREIVPEEQKTDLSEEEGELGHEGPKEEVRPSGPEFGVGSDDVHGNARSQGRPGREKDHGEIDETSGQTVIAEVIPAHADVFIDRGQDHKGGDEGGDDEVGRGDLLHPHPP